MKTGLGYEDGTNITQFTDEPDSGSTHAPEDIEYRPLSYEGRDDDGQPVFVWQFGIRRQWRYFWSATTAAFADTLRGFVALRRFLVYPDVDITANEFRARVTLFNIRQSGEKYFVELEMEEF